MEFVTLPVSQLHEYKDNWEKSTHADLQLLEEKLDLKSQFKPLFVTPDSVPDSYTVLAGNKRLMIYKKKGIERVWVTIITFELEKDELWHVYRDGHPEKETFLTKEDGMKDWSMVDNERYGEVDFDEFANNAHAFNLDWTKYVMGAKPKKIATRLNEFLMQDKMENKPKELQCPHCNHIAMSKEFRAPIS